MSGNSIRNYELGIRNWNAAEICMDGDLWDEDELDNYDDEGNGRFEMSAGLARTRVSWTIMMMKEMEDLK